MIGPSTVPHRIGLGRGEASDRDQRDASRAVYRDGRPRPRIAGNSSGFFGWLAVFVVVARYW